MAEKRSSNEEIESEKTKKMSDGNGEGGGGINSLPDNMLHHVLSFVRMKQAVQTSLVSKRWRYLWTSLPTLNFTSGKGFMRFVDAALLLGDSTSNIQRFNFNDLSYHSRSDSSSFDVDDDNSPVSESDSDSDDSSESDYDSDDIFSGKVPNFRLNIWILTAIRRNVEEIHLEIRFVKFVELLHCLFTCKSLKKLELICSDSKPHEFRLPDSISFPRLQTLHLDRLTLHHEDDFKISDFFSTNCCPDLESLTLKECGFHQKNLNINAPKLKHFVINDNSRTEQYLKHGGATGSVRVFAPKLISFHCKDYLLKRYFLENLSSLVEAYIDMKVGSKAKRKAEIWKYGRNAMIHGVKMDFRGLCNVKDLKLSAWALQIFIATYGSPGSVSTEFHNLRSLKLQTWLSIECIFGIARLLNISPNIVELSLEVIADTVRPVYPHWIKLKPADIGGEQIKLKPAEIGGEPLQCMIDHLKIVEIRGLQGRVNELKFLEVLLKNAMVLEKLTMVFDFHHQKSPSNREKQLIKYSKILQLFPRASSSVTIVFI